MKTHLRKLEDTAVSTGECTASDKLTNIKKERSDTFLVEVMIQGMMDEMEVEEVGIIEKVKMFLDAADQINMDQIKINVYHSETQVKFQEGQKMSYL